MSENGNAPALTVKELLHKIDGKLDALAAAHAATQLDLAVHKARAVHSEELANKLQEIETGQEQLNRKIAYAAGGVGLLVFAAPFIFYFLP